MIIIIKGFEEEMIFACFADTNVQKKAVLNGFSLQVLYNPPLFHMEHGAYYTKADGTRVFGMDSSVALSRYNTIFPSYPCLFPLKLFSDHCRSKEARIW